MFNSFIKTKKYSCIGVNPDIDWQHINYFNIPLELHEHIKGKVYVKENIVKIHDQLVSAGVPYKDLFKEFHWVEVNEDVKFVSSHTEVMICSVREEFKDSNVHNEMYDKHIAPGIIASLKNGDGFCVPDAIVEHCSELGVIVPLHFNRYLVSFTTYKVGSRTVRCASIEKKMESFSLAPNVYDIMELLIEEILESNGDFFEQEAQLLKLLSENEVLDGRYANYNACYYMGRAHLQNGNVEKALEHFNRLYKLIPEISPATVAKDFLRPIGELFEKKGDKQHALEWYKKATEVFSNVGLKKKIKELGG